MMRRIALFVLLFVLALITGARAQSNVVTPSTMAGFNGLPLNLGTGALAAGSTTLGTGGLTLGSTLALNLLANVSSPILSPESTATSSAPTLYANAALVQGWTDVGRSSGLGVYAQTVTDQVTLAAAANTHYGMELRTLQVMNNVTNGGELNVSKYTLYLGAGTLYGGEAIEASVDNYAATSQMAAYITDLYNEASATVNTMTGINLSWTNQNPTAGSFSTWVGVNCPVTSGSGSYPSYAACLQNFDYKQRIVTMGHMAFRAAVINSAVVNPTVTACGTSCPSQSTTNSDTRGTVTEGQSSTGFTLNFVLNDNYICGLTPLNGAAAADMAASSWSAPEPSFAAPFVVTHQSSSGASFSYFCSTTG